MTRKKGSVPTQTREKLLASATEEFYEYGFEKASLRRICAKAEVTTGALYFFFQNKEELFKEVIKPITDFINEKMEEHFTAELSSSSQNPIKEENEDIRAGEEIIDACFTNKMLCDILLGNREHPYVSGFFDGLMEKLDKQTMLLAKDSSSNFDHGIVHWFSHLQVEMVIYVISHDYDIITAKKQISIMIKFLRSGFKSLFEE